MRQRLCYFAAVRLDRRSASSCEADEGSTIEPGVLGGILFSNCMVVISSQAVYVWYSFVYFKLTLFP